MKLGERLRELRQHVGVTLLQVSQETKLSVSYLSDVERGRTIPSLETLEKLATYFNMPLGQLMASVDGWSAQPVHTLAPGLDELLASGEIDLAAAQDLSRVELRGKRPQTADEWRELYLYLKSLMRPYLRPREDERGNG